MGSNWTLKEAETQFVFLAQAALQGEPQRITIEGLGEVVVAAAKSYDLLETRPKTFVEHILGAPKLPEEHQDIFEKREPLEIELRPVDFD